MPTSAEKARAMLERSGWKQGMGLGAKNEGVATYVRVVKPRAKKGEAFGLGHDATKGTNNSDMGLDATLASIGRKADRRRTRDEGADEGAADPAAPQSPAAKAAPPRKKPRAEAASSSSDSDGSSSDSDARRRVARKRRAAADASSSSSSSSSDGDDADAGATAAGPGGLMLSDAQLFAKCNGVRLGRGGRHRFFDGKLARVKAHTETDAAAGGADPYAGKGAVKRYHGRAGSDSV